jgi:four helix bundle protein
MPPRDDVKKLQSRTIRFGLSVCRELQSVPRDPINLHFVLQLVSSSSSVASNYSEARAAESKRDFIHKMQLCLKELRESDVWFEFLDELTGSNPRRQALRSECGELTAIFVASLKTARRATERQRQDKRSL